jgi:hypothetical protein
MSWMPKTKEFDDLLFRQEVSTFWKREALLTPISPRKAEELFMRRYRALREEMK